MRALIVLASLCCAVPARALDAPAKAEIDWLIGRVEKSGARFVRNGTEYAASEAASHFRLKLSRAGKRVKTAEDFIAGLATKSSLSGEVYQMRFADGKTVPAGDWLRGQLAQHRAAAR
jgi:hypothetical protein